MTSLPFAFDNTYKDQLDGTYVVWSGDKAPAPAVLRANHDLAASLGLTAQTMTAAQAADWFTGTALPEGAASIAMAYAGHQFGGFSPQLGDGRALLMGEVIDRNGNRRDIHLKGSGRTPFSRGGDGKAVLGPVLREYLMGEAMYALGIPTTRALAAATTGEEIVRNGLEKGAVLTRVGASHLRVGTFQFFAARQDLDTLRKLADYTIARHDADLSGAPDRYIALFRRVLHRQATLIAKWVAVGFVHGVMNTDNVTISGETIDYGPCAFIDSYDPHAVFSSIDSGGRYSYGNQPTIGQWNLARFAETLIALIDPNDSDAAIAQLGQEISGYPDIYQTAWLHEMRAKLGLASNDSGKDRGKDADQYGTKDSDRDEDLELVNDLHRAMEGQDVDFTQAFRALSDVLRGNAAPVRALFNDPAAGFDAWLDRYTQRIAQDGGNTARIAAAMDAANPIYIPRNHLVEEALQAAAQDNMDPFDRLSAVLAAPFTAQPDADRYAAPAPGNFGPYQTFCGT